MRYRYETKPKSPIKKEFKQSVAVPLRDNNRADKIDEINLGGNMSIWHVTLETGYEEIVFAESYKEAVKKAEHNQDNPAYKTSNKNSRGGITGTIYCRRYTFIFFNVDT